MFDRWKSRGVECFAGVTALREAGDNLKAIEANEGFQRKFSAEFAVQDFRIGLPDPEGDERTDIAENGTAHCRRNLLDVLMREREAEAVFARFGEDADEGVGGEVLKFIDEEEEVPALGLWLIYARHGGELELRGEQAADEAGFVGAEFSFGKIGDEDAAGIHHEWDAHLGAHLAEDVANNRVQQKLADLVLDRSDGLALEPRIVSLKFVEPKLLHKWIAHFRHDSAAILRIGEHSVDAEQGSVRAIEEGGDGIVENVFEARTPGVSPDAFERPHDAAGDEMPFVGWNVGDQIEADGEVEIARIEIHQVVGPVRGNAIEQFFGEVAVRIDQANPVASGEMLHDQIAEERRLSRAGFTDEVKMLALVEQGKADRLPAAPNLLCADDS